MIKGLESKEVKNVAVSFANSFLLPVGGDRLYVCNPEGDLTGRQSRGG